MDITDSRRHEVIRARSVGADIIDATRYIRVNGKHVLTEASLTGVADGSVTEAKLASSAVSESKIADGAITSPKLAIEAVTESKIEDGAVNFTKVLYRGASTTKNTIIGEATNVAHSVFGTAPGALLLDVPLETINHTLYIEGEVAITPTESPASSLQSGNILLQISARREGLTVDVSLQQAQIDCNALPGNPTNNSVAITVLRSGDSVRAYGHIPGLVAGSKYKVSFLASRRVVTL